MLTDPLSIVYQTVTQNLVRIEQGEGLSKYATPDRVFEMTISNHVLRDGRIRVEILFTRTAPDPTPSDPFDHYRRIPVSYGMVYEFDENRFFTTDLADLRDSLSAFNAPAIQARLVAGEK